MAHIIPRFDDTDIPLLMKRIGIKGHLLEINVIPALNAEPLECFRNVQYQVNNFGGKMILGWQILKSSNLIEAEFHAIWESKNKELIDITPKQIQGYMHTLFVIDESLKYERKQLDNIRVNITKNKLVDDFISVCEAIFAFENKGDRAFQYGKGIQFNHNEVDKIKYTQIRSLKDIIQQMINNNATRNSLCLCGSKSKFKHCHGKDLLLTLSKQG